MERSKEFRIHKEQIKIKQRLDKIKSWGIADICETRFEKEPRRLSKNNLNCGCRRCHSYKYAGNRKSRKSIRDIKLQSYE